MKRSLHAGIFGCPVLIALGLTLLPSGQVGAQSPQTVVRYTFADTSGAATATAAGVTASDFARDPSDNTFYDNTAGNPAPDTNSNGWATGATFDPALYYTFTVQPAAGGTSWNNIALNVANFDAASINDGPTRFAVRSSLDGFAADLLTGTVGAAFTTDTGALNVTSTVPVEYRIYGFAAGTAGGLLQVDNVALTYTTFAVPEPSTLVGLGLAAVLTGVAVTRCRV